MSMPCVPLGIGPPNVLTYPITSLVDGVQMYDLTTVIGVSFTVRRPDKSTAVWAATVLSVPAAPTPTLLYAGHTFASNDCTIVGIHLVTATLTFPGGNVPLDPRFAMPLGVTDQFGFGVPR